MNVDFKVISSAISNYGNAAQLDQTIEECAELILAIRKAKRNESKETIEHLCDEIADVIIMCEQAALIVGPDNVQKRIDYKLDRLKNRMISAEGSVIV
jgi:NTP pyrophosphatase (non-canonical NTP hydrolase)